MGKRSGMPRPYQIDERRKQPVAPKAQSGGINEDAIRAAGVVAAETGKSCPVSGTTLIVPPISDERINQTGQLAIGYHDRG